MLGGINNKLQIVGFSKWRFEEALRWDCSRMSWELSEEESTKVLRRGSSGASCTNLCTIVIMGCRVSGSEKLWSSLESILHQFLFFYFPPIAGQQQKILLPGLAYVCVLYYYMTCRFYDLIYIAADRDNGKNEKWRSEFAHMLVHLHLLLTIRPLKNEKRVCTHALCIFIRCRQWGYCRRRGFCTYACASYFDEGSTYFFMKTNHSRCCSFESDNVLGCRLEHLKLHELWLLVELVFGMILQWFCSESLCLAWCFNGFAWRVCVWHDASMVLLGEFMFGVMLQWLLGEFLFGMMVQLLVVEFVFGMMLRWLLLEFVLAWCFNGCLFIVGSKEIPCWSIV